MRTVFDGRQVPLRSRRVCTFGEAANGFDSLRPLNQRHGNYARSTTAAGRGSLIGEHNRAQKIKEPPQVEALRGFSNGVISVTWLRRASIP